MLSKRSWTKILPKSGDKFDLFVDRLRAIGLFDLTREFAPVYRSLMEWSLAHMDDLTESDTSTANVPEVTASRFVSTGDQSADSYITEWRSMYHFDSPGGSGLV